MQQQNQQYQGQSFNHQAQQGVQPVVDADFIEVQKNAPATELSVFSPIVTIQIPNILDAKVDDVSLTDNYLKLSIGESVRCLLYKIEMREIVGEYTKFNPDGSVIPTEVVVLLSQEKRNDQLITKQLINASTMLVGVIKDLVKAGKIHPMMTGFQITYEGKGESQAKKTYDKWDLRLLGK
jgi:hypothetical protein